MTEQKTSLFANGLIWFGAAVSIAEILTGAWLAPLGLGKGLAAILLGHAIGCGLMFLAGLIGAKTGKSAMETVKISFGQKGSLLFSSLNILQLTGWTAVMIASGAAAAASVLPRIGSGAWCLIIAALIALWVLIGVRNLSRLNAVAMSALFILTVVLCVVVFRNDNAAVAMPADTMSFGAAVELSVAMPLSWLPLISDYTRTAKRPRAATGISVGVYFLVSSWMYMIGLAAALFSGNSDIAGIMQGAGLGLAALLIVIFSTVTTTFLDVHSAGVSSESVSRRCREKPVALLVCAAGCLLAALTPASRFEDFLYLIGSVFAPMIAILICDYYILKRDNSARAFDMTDLLIWLAGFIIYRCFLHIQTPLGNTLPVLLLTVAICLIVNKFRGGKKYAG